MATKTKSPVRTYRLSSEDYKRVKKECWKLHKMKLSSFIASFLKREFPDKK